MEPADIKTPRIKFYFILGSPELETVTGSVPDLGGGPRFHVKGRQVWCGVCGQRVESLLNMIQHWTWEMEQQSGKHMEYEDDIPHAEVKFCDNQKENLLVDSVPFDGEKSKKLKKG